MTTNFDTDPNTQTIAAAWASSPLGDPVSGPTDLWETTGPTEAVAPTDHPQPGAKRAILAAALASGVIGGAAFGVMLFDYTDSAQPTIVVPRSEGRLPGPPSALPTETRPHNESSPNPVAPTQKTSSDPMIAAPPSGQGTADVGTPPVGTPPVGSQGAPSVVVDIPIPDYPPLPGEPEDDPDDPEPPTPEPPVLDDPTFVLPEPPEPEPDPDPPTFLPDLPLAPLPAPDPVLKLPLAPSVELNPQPEPPSFGPSLPDFSLDFDPPAGLGS